MKKAISLMIALLLLVSLAACAKTPQPADPTEAPTEAPTEVPTEAPTETPTEDPVPQVELPHCGIDEYPKVDGSTANIPMMVSLMQLITDCSEDEASNKTTVSTTDFSYEELMNGNAKMLLVYEASRPTKEKLDPENTFDMRPIGLDALVFITNTDNPVESLTIEQIRGIFSGEITNWKEVGGLDAPINAFQRPELSGSQTLMLNLCMGDVEMAPVDKITVSNTMADVIDDIAAYDNSANAIGYSVYYYAKNMYTYPNLKFITVDGVTPTNETINSGEYPFINPFYAILPKENADPLASAIVDWLESRDGQYFVSQCGYVPYMKGIAQ